MKRLLRPSSLIVLLVLLTVVAAGWVYYSTTIPPLPVPLPVEDGDREIAWIDAATSSTAWQRFVQAVEQVARETGEGAEVERAFPGVTTAVPEVALRLPGRRGRLVFRWYKTSSEWKTDYWMRALAERNPPPLAIIGGNTTDAATAQARELRAAAEGLPEEFRPLLLLRTATADGVQTGGEPGATRVPLTDLYPGRTFRFCFSNRQMGAAVSYYIWGQDDLRPDAFPVYLVEWKDDDYSGDLIEGFLAALKRRFRSSAAAAAAADWGASSAAALGALPAFGLMLENDKARAALFPRQFYIPWSVGSFDRPSHFEAVEAMHLLDVLAEHPGQRRPMLVLSGQSQPSRRFVRALCRIAPARTRDFVMATGDTLSWNIVYRDRDVTWPVQDLPCPVVFFCHHNPIDKQAGFDPEQSPSGTEDLLLYKEIVKALVLSNTRGASACANADELRDGLRKLWLDDDGKLTRGAGAKRLFDENGDRSSGTGEHVVCLRPRVEGSRVLPEATITVCWWRTSTRSWVPSGEPLTVYYTGAPKD